MSFELGVRKILGCIRHLAGLRRMAAGSATSAKALRVLQGVSEAAQVFSRLLISAETAARTVVKADARGI